MFVDQPLEYGEISTQHRTLQDHWKKQSIFQKGMRALLPYTDNKNHDSDQITYMDRITSTGVCMFVFQTDPTQGRNAKTGNWEVRVGYRKHKLVTSVHRHCVEPKNVQ
jgi:hypothetical protein